MVSLPVYFFKGSGVTSALRYHCPPPTWDLTDTILNVNPLRKEGNGRHHSAFPSLFLSPESREKSPFMYIYILCTCTLLFIYWGIFSVHSCTVIFCRDLVYRAYRQVGETLGKEKKYSGWRNEERGNASGKNHDHTSLSFLQMKSKCLVLLTIFFAFVPNLPP